ncbi:MAG: phosphate ABC transporter permease PstA [Clostridia bacterium]|nr:phosphate ABC transporter permease PstA [Clostridia bacterium]
MTQSKKEKCTILNIFMYLSAGIICLILLGLIGYILYRGLPHITPQFLTSKPSLIRETVGILPNILNTVYVYIILITLIIVIPIGVGAAIYLNEYAKNKKVVRIIELATETLSGIPSIIYGLVGMLIFVQFFSLGTSLLAGSLTLVIMTLPTIIRTTQESLKTVPLGYREGSLALGAGKWYMIRTVVLPSAIDGIVTGCILSIGKIIGAVDVIVNQTCAKTCVTIRDTGIGLAIVKHGATYHDAEISLESTEGKGTSVTISFHK